MSSKNTNNVHFTKCIVRKCPSSLAGGLTTQNNANTVDLNNAIKEHEHYINTLKSVGLDVLVLPELAQCPDSVFIEDVCILANDFAIITNPRFASRRLETEYIREHILSHIGKENPKFKIYSLVEPNNQDSGIFLEGGDVIRFGKTHFFVGITKRTSMSGFVNFQKILSQIEGGYTATAVPLLDDNLHLKCIASYLGNDCLIGDSTVLSKYPEFAGIDLFDTKDYLGIANVIVVNGNIICSLKTPVELEEKLSQWGLVVHKVGNTEFVKLDGDVTCRSLLA